MAKSLVGLEITEESVRAVEVTTSRIPTLVCAGEVPLPQGAAKDSEILDADAVALALKQLWTRAGIHGRHVVLGVGSRRVIVREHTSQTMRPDLFRRALPFQVQDLLPVPVEQAVLDFLPVSTDGDRTTGLLVAAVAEQMEDLVAAAAKAKIVVDRIDTVPFALARTVPSAGADVGAVTAVIHIGDHTSYVVIVDGGLPRFVRIIPLDLTTSAVRSRMAQEREDVAAEIRETVPPGGGEPAQLRSRFAALGDMSASDPGVADLVGRLRDTIAFHEGRPGSRAVTAVQVSGAGAAVHGLMAALINAVPVPVSVVTASDLVRGATQESPMADLSLNLVSSIGLVLGVSR